MSDFINSGGNPDFLFPKSELDAISRPKMFQRVQKRDGTLVDFDKEKITHAIFSAAQSVGGKDRELSDHLADLVILYLVRTYQDGLLNVEQIQDAVERVLIENGHARTVKAFILYREKRAQLRSGQSLPESKGSSVPGNTASPYPLTNSLQVQTSEESLLAWNRQKIVDALLKETPISSEMAQKIAGEVETQIIYSRMKIVTIGLIRELVNAKLIEYNLSRESRLHSRLGLPVYDLEQIFSESIKTKTSWELNVSGEISRQYALHRVFSSEIIELIKTGKLLISGLESIPGPWSGPLPLNHLVEKGLVLSASDLYTKPPANLESYFQDSLLLADQFSGFYRDSMNWIEFEAGMSSLMDIDIPINLSKEIRKFILQIHSRYSSLKHYFHFHYSSTQDKNRERLLNSFFEVYTEGDDTGRSYSSIIPVLHIPAETDTTLVLPGLMELLKKCQTEKRPLLIQIDRNHDSMPHLEIQKVTVALNEFPDIHTPGQLNTETIKEEVIKPILKAHRQRNLLLGQIWKQNSPYPLRHLEQAYGKSLSREFIIELKGLEKLSSKTISELLNITHTVINQDNEQYPLNYQVRMSGNELPGLIDSAHDWQKKIEASNILLESLPVDMTFQLQELTSPLLHWFLTQTQISLLKILPEHLFFGE